MTVHHVKKKTTRGIAAEDLFRIRFVSDPQFSPDGGKIMFVQKTIDDEREYRSHLFLLSLADGTVKQWTFGKVKDAFPRWSPDGKTIAFLSNRSGKTQIWLLPADGGEARQLTSLKNGVRQLRWSPNGRFLVALTSLGKKETLNEREEQDKQESKKHELTPLIVERLQYKSDAAGFRDDKQDVLIRIDVETGEIQGLTDGDDEIGSFTISPDGKTVAFTANRSEEPDFTFTRDIFLLDIESGKTRKITNGDGLFTSLSWSPNGKMLAAIGHELEYLGATLNRVWTFDVASGEKRALTANWDVHVGDAMVGDMHSDAPSPGLIWHKEGNGLYFLASERGRVNLYHVALDGTITPVVIGDFHLYGLTIHPHDYIAVAAISDPTHIGDLYAVSLRDGKRKKLTNANEKLEKELVLSTPVEFSYPSRDGWNIQGWLMKPPHLENGQKVPMIVEIHGGPHAMYGFTFFHEMQVLAAKGYAVLFTNPRGSHGYGQTFVNAVRGDYGGMDYEDIMSGVEYALAHFDFIDETRLGVTGGSYGGFMTNWIVGHTDRFKAAVTQRSISNWLSFYGVSDIGYFFTEWEVGCNVWENPERLWRHSPLKYVKNIRTPLLILHSEKDYRCPIEQAEQLFIALKHLKRETKLVRFPEANHDLSRSGPPTLRLERLNHIVGWFAKYL
ncbi:Dipeptidyl aminopeptidase/acylaminoacyl peptidase [Parageobacillus thermantarcticus]|uniref:Dipeptidyl aminopeptidase/acylaminoacyl peptidase n=1 Tax=Parageobacillus thermantarcticus TaxID=186116 RepID=A0A1I0T9B0_9BACL|nr:S9 family peptidase [Parageobacillus thermantarcticus]SFA48287.1 Dipeptidyl aminopeptidase/acylaminoacyl peptidase [Parageobacillus thermantarcticus]